MTLSKTTTKVEATPIFLNEFLKLTIPPIDALPPASVTASPGGPLSCSALGSAYAPAPISEPEPLSAWPEEVKLWANFKDGVREALESMSDNEAFQHILAPCAFRKGDLPQATLLPSVHLWVIINVWQPMNRVFDLDEEKALGGYDGAGTLRSALFIGDHLPQVAAQLPYPIPRQAVFRPTESAQQSIAALVLIREPWVVDLTTLFDSSSSSPSVTLPDSLSSTPAAAALAEILAYMQAARKQLAVLTTYSHFVFLRNAGADAGKFGPIEISEPISAKDTDVTVYAAVWYWARLVAAQQGL
ncbi:hypothetical protein OC834_005733 [Tilletia horrida]|nr:hypothetical protein OC834_005733 [Tilletia horrida]KAK0558394.1 hypothetical protein OC844_005196 [Tilletia horrida]